MFVSASKAIDILSNKGVVVLPTDTVYGLAGNATSDSAISKIYQKKGRPKVNPLIVHVKNIQDAMSFAVIDQRSLTLSHHFWPSKPLTLVVPLAQESYISSIATAGLNSVAIRCPNHPIIQSILKNLPFPLCAPSANLSERLSTTNALDVLAQLNIPVVDGGPCQIGIESTILDMSTQIPRILRLGAVLKEDIEIILNSNIDTLDRSDKVLAPGMMLRHYAPRLPLRLNAKEPKKHEAFIAFGFTHIQTPYQLSLSTDLNEAACHLFSILNQADQPNLYQGIAMMPIPNIGIGCAINDRLKRASNDFL
jgi:L-threonylcarbamoyladenylate synthase